MNDKKRRLLTIAMFVLICALLVSVLNILAYNWVNRRSGNDLQQYALESEQEYECRMLMAETSDWSEEDIIEACQP